MLRWFKRILFSHRSLKLPKERSAQNDWIKKTNRSWQARWHDLFDADCDLVASGEFDRPTPIPGDVDCDYRLIFGLTRATSKTRQECFALFPAGPDMHRRFEDFLLSKPAAISEAEANARLTNIIALIEAIAPNEDVDFSNARVVDCATEEGQSELNNTDDIAVLLEGNSLSPHPVEQLPKTAARLFLTEPLYAAAGNSYHVSNWVTAAMDGGMTDQLQSELYELRAGGWQVALDTDGLILAKQAI